MKNKDKTMWQVNAVLHSDQNTNSASRPFVPFAPAFLVPSQDGHAGQLCAVVGLGPLSDTTTIGLPRVEITVRGDSLTRKRPCNAGSSRRDPGNHIS